MGAQLGKETHTKKENEVVSSGWGFEIPAKNKNFAVPETTLDCIPEWQGEHPPLSPPRFDLNEIIAAAASEPASTNELAERLLQGLTQYRVVILSMDEEQTRGYKEFLNDAHRFLSQAATNKKRFYPTKMWQLAYPNEKETKEGEEPYSTGYYDVHFDNRNNIRDEEWRDVYLLFCREQTRNDIKWPSEELYQSMVKYSNLFWSASVAMLTLLERALNLEPKSLLKHLVYPENELKIENSRETNFAAIRYYDNIEAKKEYYSSPQRCMIHRDRGFVTLLPKATQPGVQAFCQQIGDDPKKGVFVEMERYTSDEDVLVYTGRLLEMATKGAIKPLIHRVVRYPELERMSSPFEAKCNPNTIITEHPTTKEPVTADMIIKASDWDVLQRTVMRADGIPPEEHQPHINGHFAELLLLYGDALVVSE